MCIGIDHCRKKACLEKERCVVSEPTHIEYYTRRRWLKKNKKMNLSLKVKIDVPEVLGSIDVAVMRKCPFHAKYCSNERACEILGQCLLTHKLIKKDKAAKTQLRGRVSFNQILKIFERLMPSLNKPGKKNKK